jgi:hypothetical protein
MIAGDLQVKKLFAEGVYSQVEKTCYTEDTSVKHLRQYWPILANIGRECIRKSKRLAIV